MILRYIFLGKNIFWINTFETNQFSYQFLYNASFFESRIFKQVGLQDNFLHFVKNWIKDFKACPILNQPFYRPSDFESKDLQHVRFWTKIVSSKSNFVRTFSFKKSILGRFKTLKSQKKRFRCFLKTKIRRKQIWKKNYILNPNI